MKPKHLTAPQRPPKIQPNPESEPLTALLRQAFAESTESIREIARAVKVSHPSLIYFIKGQQSLRLDSVERLMLHFGIVCERKRK